MKKLLALAEDGELLTDLGSPALADVEVDRVSFDVDHQALEGAERLADVVDHEREGRPDTVGHPGGSVRRDRERGQHGEPDEGSNPHAQKVTDGLWMPNTARSLSQISPRVTPTSTAVTSSGSRLSRPRAAASSPSSAR